VRRTASSAALSHFITTDCSASPPMEVGESPHALSAINATQTEATPTGERHPEIDGILDVIDLKNAPRFALSSGGRKCHRPGTGGTSSHGLGSGAGPERP